MSLIVNCSIVVLVNRQRVNFTVCANNWSDEFSYIVYNDPLGEKVTLPLSAKVGITSFFGSLPRYH